MSSFSSWLTWLVWIWVRIWVRCPVSGFVWTEGLIAFTAHRHTSHLSMPFVVFLMALNWYIKCVCVCVCVSMLEWYHQPPDTPTPKPRSWPQPHPVIDCRTLKSMSRDVDGGRYLPYLYHCYIIHSFKFMVTILNLFLLNCYSHLSFQWIGIGWYQLEVII